MRDTVTKTYSLPEDLIDLVRGRASDDGVSESAVVRWALQQYFNLRAPSVSAKKKPTKKGKTS